MHAFILFDHPHEKSYCHALLDAAIAGLGEAGHTYDLVDLNREDFDPVMRLEDLKLYGEGRSSDPTVADYQRRIDAADHLVMVFPVWWEVMPALSKGFLDKVLLPGWSFEETTGMVPKGLLSRLRATVVTTMGFPTWYYRLFFGNALKGALLQGTFGFVGIPRRRRTWINIGNVGRISEATRARRLEAVRRHFAGLRA
ncbi:MAG: NAD(P)H-dependent oxidoreductase [Spirochaetales bacterium]|nr:NAD(P)H-dependent oxidoreductase [Spirochaetales bacterium]